MVKFYSSGSAGVTQVQGLAKTIVDKWQRQEQGKRTSYRIDDDHDDMDEDDGPKFIENHDYQYREHKKNIEAIREDAENSKKL